MTQPTPFAATLACPPGWRAITVDRDATNKPICGPQPGTVVVRLTPIALWGVRIYAPTAGSLFSFLPTPSSEFIPVDANDTPINGAIGYAQPGETDDEAIVRLGLAPKPPATKAAPVEPTTDPTPPPAT